MFWFSDISLNVQYLDYFLNNVTIFQISIIILNTINNYCKALWDNIRLSVV